VKPGARKRVALLLNAAYPCNRGIIAGIADTIRQRGLEWNLFLEEDFHQDLGGIGKWDGDGIIANLDEPQVAHALQGCQVPLIGLGVSRRDPGTYPAGIPFVASDEQALVQLAYEHLIEQGYPHFAMFSQPERAGTRFVGEREKAFAGLTACDNGDALIYAGPDMGALVQWLLELPKPVGIVAVTEARARLLMQACELAGCALPSQVGIIAIDHGSPARELAAVPLTSIVPGAQEMGRQAGVLLHQLMHGMRPATAPVLVAPGGLQVGASCALQRPYHPHVMRALHFIGRHARRRVKTEQVADYVGISRSWLEFHFKRELGHTVHDEILRFKLEEAKRMLRGGAGNLSEVAIECGFNSLQYLYTVFGRELGCTPRAWQEREMQPLAERAAA
jgi:LacI family transcriptional regulator